MGEVIQFSGTENVTNYLSEDNDSPVPIENVLQGAINEDLKEVIVIGRGQDNQFYMASSSGNTGKLLSLLEGAKTVVVSTIDIET